MSFTKLYRSIISSSIWNEDNETRILWVTMLAMCDPDGVVRASAGGLAHQARMTRDECEKSLGILSAPDPDSRTQDNEGRRIEACSGGYRILNYHFYREGRHEDERQEYMRQYMRSYRKQRKHSVNNVNRGKPPLAQEEEEGEVEADSKQGRCAVFTRQSGPERRNSAPAPAPDEGFGEFVNGDDLAKAHDWVAGMFGSPCLSALEREAMAENARAFLALSDADRRAVEVFQRVPRDRLDKAAAWHRPDKCLFWLRDFPEVLRSARRWTSKNGNGTRLTEAEILRSKGIGV